MKQKLSITIDEETVVLLEKMLKDGTFRNKSHAVEFSLNKILRENRPSVVNLKEKGEGK